EQNRFVKDNLINNLREPMELDLLPDGRLMFIERFGEVTIYNPETELVKPAGMFDVYSNYEDGLIGLAVDPNFEKNNWIYFDYSPAGEKSVNRISRFTLVNDQVDFDSEKIIIEIPTDRGTCCHAAGAMAFDPEGNLYITMGDDTNPWISNGFAPIDSRKGKKYGDARRSAGNTNDLRGKILRIKPLPDGTYEIPEGNLFSPNTPNARPEIYVMGVRNPFTISIDEKKNWLYWGDVGPDSGEADSLRGPRSYDEVNMAKNAGNYGWPFTRGNRQAYQDFDFATETTNGVFDPDNLQNTSPRNTGLLNLPPAENSLIWYPYAPSEEFPWTLTGGKNPMVGPVYYSENYEGKYRFPDFFDGKVFIYEWMRHWIFTLETDNLGNYRRAVPFMEGTKFTRPMDMVFGKDGSLYMLEYGKSWFARNEKARLSRIRYVRDNRAPIARISADKTMGAAPLKVNFSASESEDLDDEKLTYEWYFSGYDAQYGETATFNYKYPGIYEVELTIKDESGHTDKQKIAIQVGNEKPELELVLKGNSQFYWENELVDYEVKVSDREDGKLGEGIDSERVNLIIDLLPQGEDLAFTEVGHQEADALAGLTRGEILIKKSDCENCHAVNRKVNGPSYLEIAERYPNTPNIKQKLAVKIIKGGNGIWGETNMSAHPQLTQNQTEAMVSWILSLDEVQSAQTRLPLDGDFIAEEQPRHKKGYKVHGTYILSASYTDNGFDAMKPITARQQVLLKPHIFPATKADYISFPNPDLRRSWLRNIKTGDEFIFSNLDLTDIAGLKMEYRGNKGTSKSFKIFLKSDTEILGEVAVTSEGLGQKEAYISFDNLKGLYNLHVSVEGDNEMDALDFSYFNFEKRED
ncbi:MAG: cytochrome c, partial [Saprospiraceae bacterium]